MVIAIRFVVERVLIVIMVPDGGLFFLGLTALYIIVGAFGTVWKFQFCILCSSQLLLVATTMMVRLRKSTSILYIGLGSLSLIIFSLIIHHNYNIGNTLMDKKVFPWRDTSSDSNGRKIFFVETSGKPYLEPREACAIEAAALHHPNRIVQLFNRSPFASNAISTTNLLRIPNVRIGILNLTLLFGGTPLEQWHESGAVRDSQFPVEHLSDAVRLALLWKRGGIYMDTDVVVLRSLDDLRNAIGLQQPEEVNGAVLVFDKGHHFLEACMIDYAQNYSKSEWASQGPDLVTRVLKRTCDVDFLSDAILEPDSCGGVSLHRQVSFYPIPWPEWPKLFQRLDPTLVDASLTYTVHLWGKLSRDATAKPGDGCLLDHLMKDHCPLTYDWIFKQNVL